MRVFLNKKGWTINLVAATILLLGACSNTDNNGNEPSEEEDPSESQVSEVTVEHLKGEMTFESVPERIAVLDVQFLDHMLALEEQPVGTVFAETDNGLPEYLGDLPGDPELLGTYLEPNIEAILSIEPDLIIATDAHEDIYDQLESIAPTLVLDRMEDWQTVQLKFGDILNHPDEAQQIVDEYDQKVSDLKIALDEKIGDQTVALIRPRDDMIRLHTTEHRTAAILYEDLGLTPPDMATESTDTSSMISIEVMPELDADHLFLLQDDTNEQLTNEFKDTSVWKGLKAVTEDHVYEKNTALWIGYYSPLAIDIVLDEIAEELN